MACPSIMAQLDFDLASYYILGRFLFNDHLVKGMDMPQLEIKVLETDKGEFFDALGELADVEVKLLGEEKKSSIYSRELKSDAVTLVPVILYAATKVLPPLINAVRDVIVEFLRSRRTVISFKLKDESTVTIVGPTGDDTERVRKMLSELEF
jgi:hypothetical protein